MKLSTSPSPSVTSNVHSDNSQMSSSINVEHDPEYNVPPYHGNDDFYCDKSGNGDFINVYQ